MPFLNSVMLSPNERASMGKRLPNKSNTIAKKINSSIGLGIQASIRTSRGMRPAGDGRKLVAHLTLPQFYKTGAGRQTRGRAKTGQIGGDVRVFRGEAVGRA